jgi:hypothetical protein
MTTWTACARGSGDFRVALYDTQRSALDVITMSVNDPKQQPGGADHGKEDRKSR